MARIVEGGGGGGRRRRNVPSPSECWLYIQLNDHEINHKAERDPAPSDSGTEIGARLFPAPHPAPRTPTVFDDGDHRG
jgi:hypothetical protein